MVFPSELEPAVEELNEELSADELQHARLKNDETNRSLGFPPEQDPSDDEILDFDVGKVDHQSVCDSCKCSQLFCMYQTQSLHG